eukprot:4125195-Amphidinium_carterae.1
MLFNGVHVVDHLLRSIFNVPVVMYAVPWTLAYKRFKLTGAGGSGRMYSSNVAQPRAADVKSGLSAICHDRHSGTEASATPVAVTWWTTTVVTVVAVEWLSQMAIDVRTQLQLTPDKASCNYHHSG